MPQQEPAGQAPPAAEFAVLQQAAAWYALLRGDAASETDRQRWQAWHDAATAHRAAWRRVEAVNAEFGALPAALAHDTLLATKRQRRNTVKTLAILGVSVAGGGVLLNSGRSRDYLAGLAAQQRTGVGQTRLAALADGSQLWLNTDSAADIDYTASRRAIRLHGGEILLQSAADTQRPARPLVVEVRHGRLRALGTRFSVRPTPAGTHLAVLQGAVSVEPAGGMAALQVAAGQQVMFGADWIGRPAPADDSQAAWIHNLLMADQMRLDDFLAQLGRYRRGYLACAPEVAHLRLTGSYPLADTDRILNALEATLPVKVQRTLPWWVTVTAR